MGGKKTNEKFIKESTGKFGNKFDYSKLNYVHSEINVILICKECNTEFSVKPKNHLASKYGCKTCFHKIETKTKEQFILDAREVHGYLFDYSKVIYINNRTDVIIICTICGTEFEQSPDNHINNECGCTTCLNNSRRMTKENFVKGGNKKHGIGTFDYSKTVYIDYNTDITIICNRCGEEFTQSPNNHLHCKIGCPTCFRKSQFKTNEQFLDDAIKVHGLGRYDYSGSIYKDSFTKILIKCNKCNKHFYQKPYIHTSCKCGCTYCKQSKGEIFISDLLTKLNIEFEVQFIYYNCRHINPLKFDFYLPKYNLIIEYDGSQHFEIYEFFGGKDAFEQTQLRDKIKNEYCLKNKINLLRIPYTFSFDRIQLLIEKVLTNPIGVKQNLSLISDNMLFYYFSY